jgi:hypothetical protein
MKSDGFTRKQPLAQGTIEENTMPISKIEPELAGPMYDLMEAGGELGASCPGGNHSCLGGQLASASLSPVHDAFLSKLTRKINRLLAEAAERGRDRNLDLELISVGDQVLLAWTSNAVPQGARRVKDTKELNQLLGVRPRSLMHHETSENQS